MIWGEITLSDVITTLQAEMEKRGDVVITWVNLTPMVGTQLKRLNFIVEGSTRKRTPGDDAVFHV